MATKRLIDNRVTEHHNQGDDAIQVRTMRHPIAGSLATPVESYQACAASKNGMLFKPEMLKNKDCGWGGMGRKEGDILTLPKRQ